MKYLFPLLRAPFQAMLLPTDGILELTPVILEQAPNWSYNFFPELSWTVITLFSILTILPTELLRLL